MTSLLLRSTLLRAPLVLAIATVGLLGGARTAHTQNLELPRGRQGYYRSYGLLVYETQQSTDGQSQGSSSGGIFTFRTGQMLTSRFGLGIHFETGRGSGDGKSLSTTGLGLDGQFNPIYDLAVHVGLGLGYGSVNDPKNLEKPTRGGYGSVYELAVSWDLFLTRHLTGGWSIAPTAVIRYLPGDSLNGVWVCGGFQISSWSGRPRRELILPDSESYK